MWCKALEESTYTDPQFIRFSERFTMIKLNAEKDTVTADHYRVGSYPTIMVLNPDGTEIDRLVGYSRAPGFISQVDDYLAGKNTLASMVAAESTNISNPQFEAALADKFFEHGLYADAKVRYLRVIAMDPKNVSGQIPSLLMSLSVMSRKEKDYTAARQYAQTVVDHYPQSEEYKSAILAVGSNYKRAGDLNGVDALAGFARMPGQAAHAHAQVQLALVREDRLHA
jgi:thioredoxin-like negative regulator of GroEL